MKICTDCEIHHYENCPGCFGFGIRAREGEISPIAAGEAIGDRDLPEWKKCPKCKSTPKGIPK